MKNSIIRAILLIGIIVFPFAIIGCDKQEQELPTTAKQPDIKLTLLNTDHTTAVIDITPSDADWCSIVVYSTAPEVAPTAEDIHTAENRVDFPADRASTHFIADLEPLHHYYVYAAVGTQPESGESLYDIASIEFETAKMPPTLLLYQTNNTLWYDGIGDDGSDNYYIGLSECEVAKTDDNWVPVTEGCNLLFLDLYGANTIDKANPVLPDGIYTFGEDKTEGTLHNKYSGVVDHNGNSVRLTDGEVSVSRNGNIYTISTMLTLEDGRVLENYYEGELSFEIGHVAPKVPKIEENVETTFIGVKAIYIKPEMSLTGMEQINLYLYDKEPDAEGEQTDGYLLTCEVTMQDIDLYNIDFPSRQYDVTTDYQPYTTPVGDVVAISDIGVHQLGTTVRYINGETGEALYAAIVSGHFTVSSTDNNETYTVDVEMTTAEGYTFKGTYYGAIPVEGELPPRPESESPLTGDKVIDLGPAPELTAEYREYSNVFLIEAKGSGEYDTHVDGFRIEIMASEDMDRNSIPCGTFQIGTEAGNFIAGSIDRTDGTQIRGTFGYIDYLYSFFIAIPWYDAMGYAPATDGEITITDNGDGTHTIEYELYDDAYPANKITCNFTGKFNIK